MKPVTEFPAHRWARLKKDVRCLLRRGAWYPVVSQDGAGTVVLAVRDLTVSVPLSYLELTDARPNRWTVVTRPSDAHMLPESWGPLYAVCPNCANRAALTRPADRMACQRCGQTFEVAWDEPYMGAGQEAKRLSG